MNAETLLAAAIARDLDPIDAALLVAETLFRLEFYESAARNMEFLLNDGRGRDLAAMVAVLPSREGTSIQKFELDL